MKLISGHRILSESICWIGKTQVAVRVRKIVHSDKIAVDLLIFSPEVTCEETDAKLKKIACNAVLHCGVASLDYSKLCDFAIDRKVHLPDGCLAGIHIRKITLAFHGVA